jgi:hypothetical protein
MFLLEFLKGACVFSLELLANNSAELDSFDLLLEQTSVAYCLLVALDVANISLFMHLANF